MKKTIKIQRKNRGEDGEISAFFFLFCLLIWYNQTITVQTNVFHVPSFCFLLSLFADSFPLNVSNSPLSFYHLFCRIRSKFTRFNVSTILLCFSFSSAIAISKLLQYWQKFWLLKLLLSTIVIGFQFFLTCFA